MVAGGRLEYALHATCRFFGSGNPMDISALSDRGLVALVLSLHASKLQEKVDTSVLKLANDQIKQDGENA